MQMEQRGISRCSIAILPIAYCLFIHFLPAACGLGMYSLRLPKILKRI